MKRFRAKPSISLFACVACAFGLLLWARLLLVSSPPRIATAHPAQTQQLLPQPGAQKPVQPLHHVDEPSTAPNAAQPH